MKEGFSIIELLVVVAIIAIIASFAVPIYQVYLTRSQLTKNIAIMQKLTDDVQSIYASTGTYPSTITFNNISVNSNWTNVNYGQIYSLIYDVSSDGKGAAVGVNLSGFSGLIAGYVAPTGPVPTQASSFWFGIREINGVMKSACGWINTVGAGGVQSIPLVYLPGGCQCNDVGDMFILGTGPCS